MRYDGISPAKYIQLYCAKSNCSSATSGRPGSTMASSPRGSRGTPGAHRASDPGRLRGALPRNCRLVSADRLQHDRVGVRTSQRFAARRRADPGDAGPDRDRSAGNVHRPADRDRADFVWLERAPRRRRRRRIGGRRAARPGDAGADRAARAAGTQPEGSGRARAARQHGVRRPEVRQGGGAASRRARPRRAQAARSGAAPAARFPRRPLQPRRRAARDRTPHRRDRRFQEVPDRRRPRRPARRRGAHGAPRVGIMTATRSSAPRLYISCDMEGTAAVCTWTQVDPTNTTEYPYYRRLMSQEVRAAIDGAREAGAGDVLVNDSHASMRLVQRIELAHDVRMIYGNRKPFSMAEGFDGSFDAAFFTGYHGAIGTADATLDHTYTGDTLRETRVNGRACSEAMLNAAMLGLAGVPVVLITGDRACIEQTKAVMPWITGVIVKDSIGRYATNSLSPPRARELIRAGARSR